MKAMIHGRLILEDREERGQALVFDKKILGIMDTETALQTADEVIDAHGAYVCPGLIDVHIHGWKGADVSDGDPEGIRRICRGLLGNGVTSFLPTTMTIAWSKLEAIFDVLRTLKKESLRDDFAGSEILGCHAEGPFINPERKGAQLEENIIPADAERVLPFRDIIRLMTYAPEMPGALAFTRRILDESDIVLSIGHTAADFATAMAAVHLGADHFTHTFNAMTPLVHREPGVVGAAMYSDGYAELIADTFHVSTAMFSIMSKVKGDRLCLITDCLPAGGLSDGEYNLGGEPFVLRGIECRLKDGTIAGSVLRMNQAVRNLRDHASIPMWQAVRAASLTPARSVRADGNKGSLMRGKDADIVLMDENCEVLQTWVRGNLKFQAQ